MTGYVVKIDSHSAPNVSTNGFMFFHFQKQRFANLAKFKSNVFKILIATDVAARYRENTSQHISGLLIISLPCFISTFMYLFLSKGVWIFLRCKLSSITTHRVCQKCTSTEWEEPLELVRYEELAVRNKRGCVNIRITVFLINYAVLLSHHK